jgi:hypothetical protein
MYTNLISNCFTIVSFLIDVTFNYLRPTSLVKLQTEETGYAYAILPHEQIQKPIPPCMIQTIEIFFNIIIEYF